MAFSATQWRDLLNNYTGGPAVSRTWSAMGNKQWNGAWYLQFINSPAFGSPRSTLIQLKNCDSNYNGKNVQSFYKIKVAFSIYTAFFNAYGFPTFISANLSGTGTAFSTPANVYTITNMGTYAFYSTSGPSTGYTSNTIADYVRSVNSANTTFFYDFSPWQTVGPGDNVAIGRGPTGSPSSGYPYQRIYINGYCP